MSCAKCGSTFNEQKQRVEDLESKGKSLLCADCLNKINLGRLARKGQDAQQSENSTDVIIRQKRIPRSGKKSVFWKKRYKSTGTTSTKPHSVTQRQSSRKVKNPRTTSSSYPHTSYKESPSKNTSLASGNDAWVSILIIFGLIALGFFVGGWFGVILAVVFVVILAMQVE